MTRILNSRILNVSVKVLIFLLLGLLLYQQVFNNKSARDIWLRFRESWYEGDKTLLLGILFLMLVNWGIEAVKWRKVIRHVQKISFLRSVQGILFGVTFSLFTPNRMGEFGGRIMALPRERFRSIAATLVGSFSQIAMNLSIGSLALLVYLLVLRNMDLYLVIVFLILFIVFEFAIYFAFFHLADISRALKDYPLFRKIYPYASVIQEYERSELTRLLLLSGLRYLTYCLQFFLMIRLFGIPIPFAEGIILVSSIYFVQTIFPSYALLEVGIRGNVAVYFLGLYTDNDVGVLAATFALWMINLILPGIVGAVLAMGFRFFREKA